MTEFLFSGVGSLIPFSGGGATNPSVEAATPEIAFGSVLQRAIGVVQQARIDKDTPSLVPHTSSSLSLLAVHPAAYRIVFSQTDDILAKTDLLHTFERSDTVPLSLQDGQSVEQVQEQPHPSFSFVIQLSGRESSIVEDADNADTPKGELQQLQGAIDALVHVVAALHSQKSTADNSASASAGTAASPHAPLVEGSGRVRVLAYGGEEHGKIPFPLGQEGEISETRDAGNNAAVAPLQADSVLPDDGVRDKSASGSVAIPAPQGVVQEDVVEVAQGKAGEQTQSGKVGKTTPREEVASGTVIAGQSVSTETPPAAPQKAVFPERAASNKEPLPVHGASQERVERQSVENNGGKNAPTQSSPLQGQSRGVVSSPVRNPSNHIVVDVPTVGAVEISIRATGQGRAHVDIAMPQRASLTPATFATLLQEVTQRLEQHTVPVQGTGVEGAILENTTAEAPPAPVLVAEQPRSSAVSGEVAPAPTTTPTVAVSVEQRKQSVVEAANNDAALPQEVALSKQAEPSAEGSREQGVVPNRDTTKMPTQGENIVAPHTAEEVAPHTMRNNPQQAVEVEHVVSVKTEGISPTTAAAPAHSFPSASAAAAILSPDTIATQQPSEALSIESLRFTFVGADEATAVGEGDAIVPPVLPSLKPSTTPDVRSSRAAESLDMPISTKTVAAEVPIADIGASGVEVPGGNEVVEAPDGKGSRVYGEQKQLSSTVFIPAPDRSSPFPVQNKEWIKATEVQHPDTPIQPDDTAVPVHTPVSEKNVVKAGEKAIPLGRNGGENVVSAAVQDILGTTPPRVPSVPEYQHAVEEPATIPAVHSEENPTIIHRESVAVLPNRERAKDVVPPPAMQYAKEVHTAGETVVTRGHGQLELPIERVVPHTTEKGVRSTEEMFLPLAPRREAEQADEPKTQEEHREIEPEREVVTEARRFSTGTTTVYKQERDKVEQLPVPLLQHSLGDATDSTNEGVPVANKTEAQEVSNAKEQSGVQETASTKHSAEPKEEMFRSEGHRGKEYTEGRTDSGAEQHAGSKTDPKVVNGMQGEHSAREVVATVLPTRETEQSNSALPTAKPTVLSSAQADVPPALEVPLPERAKELFAAFRQLEHSGGFTVRIDAPTVPHRQTGEQLAQVQVNNSQAYGNSQAYVAVQPSEQNVPVSTAPLQPNVQTAEQAVFSPIADDVNAVSEKNQAHSVQPKAMGSGKTAPAPEVGMAIEEGKQNGLPPSTRIEAPDDNGAQIDAPSRDTQGRGHSYEAGKTVIEGRDQYTAEQSGQAIPLQEDAPAPSPSITRQENEVEHSVLSQQKTGKEAKPFVVEPGKQTNPIASEQVHAVASDNEPDVSRPLSQEVETAQVQPQQRDRGQTQQHGGERITEVQSTIETRVADIPRAEVTEQPKVELPLVPRVANAEPTSMVSRAEGVQQRGGEQAPVADAAAQETIAAPVSARVDMPKAAERPAHLAGEHRAVPTPSIVPPDNVEVRGYGEPRSTEGQTPSIPAMPSVRPTVATAAASAVPVRTTAGKLSANRSTEPWRDITRKEGSGETASARELPLMDALAQRPSHSWRDAPEPIHRERAMADATTDNARVPDEAHSTSAHSTGEEQGGATHDGNQTKQHDNRAFHTDGMPVRLSVPHQVKPAPSFMRSFSNVLPAEMPQIVQSVMRTVPSGAGGVVHMALNPEALGEVVVAITVLDGVADVVIDTEHKEAQKAVEAHLPALKERLAQTGLQVENVEVRTKQEPTVQSDASRFGRQGGQTQEEHKSRQEFLRSFRHLQGTNYEPIEMPELRSTPLLRPQVQNGRFERYA